MYKNQLQEICQKLKISLPIYQTERVGGLSHCPQFRSSIIIIYNGDKITEYGNTFMSKKKAEMSAAEKMLISVTQMINNDIEEFSLSSSDELYILIDMENIHMGDFFDKHKFGTEFHFIGFSTENHPSIKNCSSRVEVVTIKTDRRDGCDILMIGYTAQLIMTNNVDIIIVTGDHFGLGLVDYIYSQNNNISAKCVKTVKVLIDTLKRIE